MSDADRLAAIEARVNAATPGPWTQSGKGTGTHVSSFAEKHGYQIHSMQWVQKESPDVFENMEPVYVKDAAFIAHSRADVPFLLARVKALKVALREFGQHPYECLSQDEHPGPCDCGLVDALDATEAE